MVAALQCGKKKNENRRPQKRQKSGEEANRTPDLVHAKHALYQLSYIPDDQKWWQ
jgi:hypothetical protein